MSTPSTRAAARGATGTWLLVTVSALVLGALGWWGVGRGEGGTVIDPDRVVLVERRDLLDAVTATGRVEPRARVAVMSRASGILEAILVEEGDRVEAGQVLAELDREQLAAELDRDRADLASAEARLHAAQARRAEAEVRLEDPALAFARRELERLDGLVASGDLTERERDEAALGLAEVEFRLTQVRASLPVLVAAVEEAQADLLAARASVEQSETALREATIRSPLDGVVLLRNKEVGDGVSSLLTAGGNATQILVLGDLSEMFVEARVDEVDLGRIHVGQPARVTVDAHRGRVLRGAVERIAPAGTVDGNGIVTFEVRVTVDDPDGLLRPDMTADARLVLAERAAVPALPQRALRRAEDGTWWVQRVAGETVEPAAVTLGVSDGLMTEIVGGLDPGDRVLLPDAGAPRGR